MDLTDPQFDNFLNIQEPVFDLFEDDQDELPVLQKKERRKIQNAKRMIILKKQE